LLLTVATSEQERKLAQLIQTPRVLTPRDQAVMQALSRVKVMELSQIHRLFWPQSASPRTAYHRLRTLVAYGVLEGFAVSRATVETPGLAYQLCYRLSPLGRAWLQRQHLAPGYRPKSAQVGHDLLVAEVYVQVHLALHQRQPAWGCRWYGEPEIAYYPTLTAERPLLVPDGLAVLYPPEAVQPAFAFFLASGNVLVELRYTTTQRHFWRGVKLQRRPLLAR
jgi:hypothetical protein